MIIKMSSEIAKLLSLSCFKYEAINSHIQADSLMESPRLVKHLFDSMDTTNSNLEWWPVHERDAVLCVLVQKAPAQQKTEAVDDCLVPPNLFCSFCTCPCFIFVRGLQDLNFDLWQRVKCQLDICEDIYQSVLQSIVIAWDFWRAKLDMIEWLRPQLPSLKEEYVVRVYMLN